MKTIFVMCPKLIRHAYGQKGITWADFVEQRELVLRRERRNVHILDARQLLGQRRQLVEVRREHAEAVNLLGNVPGGSRGLSWLEHGQDHMCGYAYAHTRVRAWRVCTGPRGH